MHRSGWIWMVLVLSCAPTSSNLVPDERVPRRTYHYSNGESFELDHADALPGVLDPRRPHDVRDGTLTGRICGVEMQYDARWLDGTLTLTGYGDIQWPGAAQTGGPTTLILGVRALGPGRRTLNGQFGGHLAPDASSPVVDLDVSGDHLQGRVGNRQFSLTAKGDWLVGRVREPDQPFAIYGRAVLSAMEPAEESLALVGLLACSDSVVEYEGHAVQGFALARLEPPKGTIVETGEIDAVDGGVGDGGAEPEPPADVRRTIDPANAERTVEALRDDKGRAAVVYLPPNPTDEMTAMADSVVAILRRAGLTVEQQAWRERSCRPRGYDLAVVAGQPATPQELAAGVRLTLTKLNVYVCQSAHAIPDKLGVLVLPPHR